MIFDRGGRPIRSSGELYIARAKGRDSASKGAVPVSNSFEFYLQARFRRGSDWPRGPDLQSVSTTRFCRRNTCGISIAGRQNLANKGRDGGSALVLPPYTFPSAQSAMPLRNRGAGPWLGGIALQSNSLLKD
ncbi:hypothetical protein R1flu_023221 [Riccia fluitans]|uniref:Ribosomal protein L2 n=1 Tax=Riccia fluitans TaxID=41844 RepID=A0ABD1XRF6_9MARC